ncbi:MAG: hypothetical protein ACSLFQ_16590 [Thermoanaerobaculia bacterium]
MRLQTAALALGLMVLAVIPASAQQAAVNEAMQKSPEELIEGIENDHPAVYYVLASKLFSGDRKDESIFWFYAGQLRYRFHLAAHPELPKEGDPALLASLSEAVGKPINEYAFGDIEVLDATLEKVKSWDDETPNGYTSKTEYAAAWKSTREGMEQLVVYVRANGNKIRAQRTAAGLENRN